jgi:PAS domain S-box-containing protein
MKNPKSKKSRDNIIHKKTASVEQSPEYDLLIQAEKNWEDTFNTITDMITIHDRDFNIIRANKAAERVLGLPSLEDREAKCFKFYHGTNSPPEGCPSCNCLQTGKPDFFEIFEPFINKFIEIRVMPRFDSNNQVIGLIHIVRDISERKKIEESNKTLLLDITRAKREWEMTFDNAIELIILVDSELNITRCNRSFSEFTQKPIRELIGRRLNEFLTTDPGNIESKITNGKTEIMTGNGRWLYLSFNPIFGEEGELLHSILIGTDITDIKNIQQKLVRSEDELRKKVQELEKFYQLGIGRELRIKKLKNEVIKLNTKLSNRLKED